jgi:hypothetical protein
MEEIDDQTNDPLEEGYVVAREVAESDFDRFIEAMDIDVDPAFLDDDDKKNLKQARSIFVEAVMEGVLTVDVNGRPVFTPKRGNTKPITFNEPDGAALLTMDGKKKGHDIAKSYVLLAAITKEPVVRFSNMKQRDLRICSTLLALFLG